MSNAHKLYCQKKMTKLYYQQRYSYLRVVERTLHKDSDFCAYLHTTLLTSNLVSRSISFPILLLIPHVNLMIRHKGEDGLACLVTKRSRAMPIGTRKITGTARDGIFSRRWRTFTPHTKGSKETRTAINGDGNVAMPIVKKIDASAHFLVGPNRRPVRVRHEVGKHPTDTSLVGGLLWRHFATIVFILWVQPQLTECEFLLFAGLCIKYSNYILANNLTTSAEQMQYTPFILFTHKPPHS